MPGNEFQGTPILFVEVRSVLKRSPLLLDQDECQPDGEIIPRQESYPGKTKDEKPL